MVSAFQQETGDAKERLAQKRARDAAGNLIVARGRRGFAGDFPERAPGKRIGHRRPVAQAVRPGDPVIHRPLVGMPELIDLERIVVDDPGAAQIAADRGRRHLEVGGIEQQAPSEIHGRVHRHDLDHRKNVAFVDPPPPSSCGSAGRMAAPVAHAALSPHASTAPSARALSRPMPQAVHRACHALKYLDQLGSGNGAEILGGRRFARTVEPARRLFSLLQGLRDLQSDRLSWSWVDIMVTTIPRSGNVTARRRNRVVRAGVARRRVRPTSG